MLVTAAVALGTVVGWACAAESGETPAEQLARLIRAGDNRGVLRLYESLPEDTAVPSELKRGVAARYRSAGRYSAAETIYQALLSANAADEEARRGLVMTLFDSGDFSRALRVLEKADSPLSAPRARAPVSATPDTIPAPAPVPVTLDAEPVPELAPAELEAEPAPEPGPAELEAQPKEPDQAEVIVPIRTPTEITAPQPAATEIVTPVPVETDTAVQEPVQAEIVTPVPIETDTVAPEPAQTEIVTPVPIETRTVIPEPVATEIVTVVPIERDTGPEAVTPVPAETNAQPETAAPEPTEDDTQETGPVGVDVTEPGMADTGAEHVPPLAKRPADTPPVATPPAETPESEDPATTLARVLDLFEANRREEAVQVLDEALSDRPNETHLLYTKAQLLRTNGDYAEALETCEDILKLIPGDENVLTLKAELMLAQAGTRQDKKQPVEPIAAREPDESVAARDSVATMEPDRVAPAAPKSQLLVAVEKADRSTSAAPAHKPAPAATGDTSSIAESYILNLCRSGKSKEAIARFEALPVGYEPSIATKRSVAKCYFEERRFKDAKPLYESILEEDPNDQTALRGLVTLLFNLGQYNKAVETLSKATLTPADVPGRSSL